MQMDTPMEITVIEIPLAMEDLQFVHGEAEPSKVKSTVTIEEIND